jgi:hypothetical protein
MILKGPLSINGILNPFFGLKAHFFSSKTPFFGISKQAQLAIRCPLHLFFYTKMST